MYLFDTNAFELLLAKDENTLAKVVQNKQLIWLSSVSAEERLAGYMNSLNRARSPRNALSLPQAHQDFVQAIEDCLVLPIFIYSPEAEAIYQTFPPAIVRIGPQDCRIATQALAHGLTVVTRNIRDFQAIGAPCIDWSVPSD